MVLGTIGAIIVGVGAGFMTAAKNIINDSDGSREDKKVANFGVTIFEIIFYVILAVYLLWIITAILMIVGTAKSQRGYLVPWIIMTIILTILSAIQILINLINVSVTFASATTALSFCLSATLFVLNCYALTAVLSFFKDRCIDKEIGGKNVV